MLGAVEIAVVSSAGKFIDQPLTPAVDDPRCEGVVKRPVEQGNENPMSIGFRARFGEFDFLDLGDLTMAGEHDLVCPRNKLGTIDLWQVDHHGSELSNAPEFVRAIDFTTAVMDNGATKGGARSTFATLRQVAPGKDVWQLHRAVNNDAQNNAPEELIANLAASPDAAHAISASIDSRGSFVVTNHRTGASRTYAAR